MFNCSYLKYPCNDESFALANAIRVVYEFATGCRLNPTLPKRLRDDLFGSELENDKLSFLELIKLHLIQIPLVVHDNIRHLRFNHHTSHPKNFNSFKILYQRG